MKYAKQRYPASIRHRRAREAALRIMELLGLGESRMEEIRQQIRDAVAAHFVIDCDNVDDLQTLQVTHGMGYDDNNITEGDTPCN